jgi:glucosamine 6-phosphate synthetase-like amidotransferase/phosphosugar isomerase protein
MCGLCGVLSSHLDANSIEAFKGLMIVSTLRGEDGAGIVGIPKQAGAAAEILRSEGTAADLATGMEFWKLAEKKDTHLSCLMGHARHPTSGTFDLEHVHPHTAGPIIGMHNGTLTKVMNRKPKQTESDSKLFFKAVANTGIDNAIDNTEGAYALTFVNTGLDTLYLLRNKLRPLSLATVEGVTDEIFWASEGSFLKLVLGRIYNNRKITTSRLNEDMLVSFRLHYTGPVSALDYRLLKSSKPSVPLIEDKSTKMVATAKNRFVTEAELAVILAQGCAYCMEPGTQADYNGHNLTWLAENEYLCHHCVTHDQFARDYAVSRGIYDLPKLETFASRMN